MAKFIGSEVSDHFFGTDVDDRFEGRGGSDLIIDNFVSNDSMSGGYGDDRLFDLGGSDVLKGGAGSDQLGFAMGNSTLDGGGGGSDRDRLDLTAVQGAVRVNLTKGTLKSESGDRAVVLDIEQVTDTSGNDLLIGGNRSNDDYELFEITAGNDTVDGRSGFDIVSFTIIEGGVRVNLKQGVAWDQFGGRDLLKHIEGVAGTGFDDSLRGDAGDNLFEPGGGVDTIFGGGGKDTVVFSGSPVEVDLAQGSATKFWEDTEDTLLRGIENVSGFFYDDDIRGDAKGNVLKGLLGDDDLRGRDGSDTLEGDVGRDLLIGAGDSDSIAAGSGDDSILGGAGIDTLSGGSGRDLFFFHRGSDTDIIEDFERGRDRIDLRPFQLEEFSALRHLASEVGPDVHITFRDGQLLVLSETRIEDLRVSDFLL